MTYSFTPSEVRTRHTLIGYASAANDLASLLAGAASSGPGIATITAAAPENVASSPAAWATTLGVLAADAVLVGYWYHQSEEAKARRAIRPASPFFIEALGSHGRRDED